MANGFSGYESKTVVVLGIGNVLFGDDGFGPEVIEFLQEKYTVPENVVLINAGCSARSILFDILLSEKKPEKIIIIDAFDIGLKPGKIFEINIDEIPENKIDDFSMHQIPTSNLLKELRDASKIEIKIISCQPENIPETVSMGLSGKISNAIPAVCRLVMKEIKKQPVK
ncbi:MAG: coenzyme F420-reducing hydrogenase, FrhD protein [Actinobacteria bacterium]|nr:coenzyme F420-reducing hydrogenase, FrhD protein [Actinomycetota bacterium]